jgi:hypothetical protein
MNERPTPVVHTLAMAVCNYNDLNRNQPVTVLS